MTRKRRYLISAVVLVACVGLALGVVAMLPERHWVMKACFDRIELGMCEQDVDQILRDSGKGMWIADQEDLRIKRWPHSDGTDTWIQFDPTGKVLGKQFNRPAETTLDKLRRWLGLPASN